MALSPAHHLLYLSLMLRFVFLTCLVVLSVSLQAKDRPPDILVLVADDLGWNDVGWHNTEIKTPILDQLLKGGVELDWHYVQPQCTPTRVALLTGNYPSRYGRHCTVASNDQAIPFSADTLPRYLKKLGGYQCGLFGKWHLGSLPDFGPNRFGFDYSYGSLAGACGIWDHRYRLNRPRYSKTWHRNHQFVEEEGHSLELCTDEAINWVRTFSAEDPLLCYMPYHAVHTPLAEKDQKWFAMNKHIADPDRRHFAAYISHLDHAIGRLVDAFKETGRYQNTIILFTSDNGGVTGAYNGGAYPKPDPKLKAGFSSNKPLRAGKSTSYEGGIRVPAFVHWQAKLQPGICTTPIHVTDWLPTFLNILDPKFEAKIDGKPMNAYLANPQLEAPPRTIYTTWHGNRQLALRHGPWKIRASGTDKAEAFDWELYNLAQDPHEKTNLATRNAERVEELRKRFLEIRKRDGTLWKR